MRDKTPEEAVRYAEAITALQGWAQNWERRDALIREAHAAGVAKSEIARRMGISRDTVVRVLGSDEEEGGGKDE